MPSMADITVKKNDGTTDIIFSQKVPSAGDRSPALWKSTSVGSAPAHQPTLEVTSRWNGERTARRVEYSFSYPETATAADGSVSVINRFVGNGSVVIPQGMAAANINEGASQLGNLIASALIKSVMKEGYAPT